jgi:hypothetical protein
MTLPDDPLLQALGKLARERDEEVTQLERRCRDAKEPPRAHGGTRSSGTRPATDLEALATSPFSAAEQARMTEHVRRHLRPVPAGSQTSSPRKAAGQPVARSSKPAGQQPALKVLRGDATPLTGRRTQPALRVAEPVAAEPAVPSILDARPSNGSTDRVRPIRRAIALVVPLCAVAAAALLWFSPAPSTVRELPAYSLDLASAPSEYRSTATSGAFDPAALAQPIALGAGSRLVLSLRPATAVAEPIQTRVIVRQATGASRWPATVETSPLGAVRLQLERANTPLRGPAELIVLIGHGESAPPAMDRGGLGWQRWSLPIILGE